MSNSIWKMPEEKPKSFSFILEHHKAYDFDNHKVITAYNIFETGGNPQNPFDESTIRWCYLDELLAQADKAERLQKAVDLAIETLKFYADRRHYKNEELDLSVYEYNEKEETGVLILDDGGRIENGKKARDTIKQLIKE